MFAFLASYTFGKEFICYTVDNECSKWSEVKVEIQRWENRNF